MQTLSGAQNLDIENLEQKHTIGDPPQYQTARTCPRTAIQTIVLHGNEGPP